MRHSENRREKFRDKLRDDALVGDGGHHAVHAGGACVGRSEERHVGRGKAGRQAGGKEGGVRKGREGEREREKARKKERKGETVEERVCVRERFKGKNEKQQPVPDKR